MNDIIEQEVVESSRTIVRSVVEMLLEKLRVETHGKKTIPSAYVLHSVPWLMQYEKTLAHG